MRVTVRVRPASAHVRVGGRRQDALMVCVTSPAVDGRATLGTLEAVARAFGVRTRAVRLVTGERSRTKIVEIEGDQAALAARLDDLLESR